MFASGEYRLQDNEAFDFLKQLFTNKNLKLVGNIKSVIE